MWTHRILHDGGFSTAKLVIASGSYAVLFYWDGRGPDGNFIAVPSTVWIPDAKIMRPTGIYVFPPTVSITGTGVAPNIEVKSDPYFIASSYEQASKIVYRVSQDATVRVTLLPPGIADPSHASAIVLVNNLLQPAKDGGGVPINYTVEWKGYMSHPVRS
jgi:hypothetical protein